ncbi:MAG: alpha/beta fold hydrolase [Planctomycetes bacterium]|nr:alpha/beta fold hydrolase [Planctomycetota bacterium]
MDPAAGTIRLPPGATILALHGNGGGAVRFDAIAARFAPGALHAVTLPGFDGRPLGPRGATLAGQVESALAALGELTRPRIVLGHGIGGSLALELAQRHRDALDALLLHAPVGARLEQRRFPRLMRPRVVRGCVRRALGARLLRPLWRRWLFRAPLAPDVDARFFAGYRDCAAFGHAFDWYTPAWFASLRPVDVPAVLLWGGRERVLTADQSADFAALLPAARTVVVPDWDHFPMLEEPDDYARRIADLATGLVAELAR